MALNKRISLITISVIFLIYNNCTQNLSGVETTNGYTVVASSNSIEGVAPKFSRVFLFDTSYIPYIGKGLGVVQVADEQGYYSFTCDSGVYNILIVDPLSNNSGIIKNVTCKNQHSYLESHKGKLKKTGSVSGKIESDSKLKCLVFLSGLDYHEVVSENESYKFENVPPGEYLLQIILLDSSYSSGFSWGEKVPVLVSSGENCVNDFELRIKN
ncbi:MAG TPA: hypothetical protein VKY57_09535 [Chitinispirillaceae bacterium]|nr:hypothetical protein [Chitinispirillaceae bacterium]